MPLNYSCFRPLVISVALAGGLAVGLSGCAHDNDVPPPVVPVSPVESVPVTSTVVAPGLAAPVDVVRDELGVPHIYAQSFPDAAFAQGYFMAADRLVMMDLSRRTADGTLAELLGAVSPDLIDDDINMRVHHLGSTASQILAVLRASTDEQDRTLVTALIQFAAGVNAYLAAAASTAEKVISLSASKLRSKA